MLAGQVRKVLLDFINSKFRVDEWGLGLPKSSSPEIAVPSIGLDKPFLDLNKVSILAIDILRYQE